MTASLSFTELLRIAAVLNDERHELTIEERQRIRQQLQLTVSQSIQVERDQLIRACRRKCFTDHNELAAAEEIARGLKQYHRGSWRLDKREEAPPTGLSPAKEFYWRILRIYPQFLSAHTVRKILREQ